MTDQDRSAANFIGLTLSAAEGLASLNGLNLRNFSVAATSGDGFVAYMDDFKNDRVNVWLDDELIVIKAEFY